MIKWVVIVVLGLTLNACGGNSDSDSAKSNTLSKKNTVQMAVDTTLFTVSEGEMPDAFIHRIHPNREMVSDSSHVVSRGDSSRPMIVAFYAPDSQTASVPVGKRPVGAIAWAYIPVAQNQYKEILIDTIHQVNNLLNIKAVFFANCDSDLPKELVILYSTTERHRGAGIYGEFYETLVYDHFVDFPKRFSFLEPISKQLMGGFEGDAGNELNQIAKFKTAKDIQKELKRLGYGKER
jgi:hypothetical protein